VKKDDGLLSECKKKIKKGLSLKRQNLTTKWMRRRRMSGNKGHGGEEWGN